MGVGILGFAILLFDNCGQDKTASSPEDPAPPPPPHSHPLPTPKYASLHIEFPRQDYLVGETVWFDFVLENKGDEPFTINTGHDYRAPRSMRYQVKGRDAEGQPVADPYPAPFQGGGIGGDQTLQPGETFRVTLDLTDYCLIETPGTYEIQATHDFGWRKSDPHHPSARATLLFRQPTPDEAHARVNYLLGPTLEPAELGNRSDTTRALQLARFKLRSPLYLPALREAAANGQATATEGIGGIPTIEATAALVELCRSQDISVAIAATNMLLVRLPHSEAYSQINRFSQDPEARARLVKRCWDTTFTNAVRELGQEQLASQSVGAVTRGTLLLQGLGDPADAPVLLSALQQQLDEMATSPNHDPREFWLPSPFDELNRALRTMVRQGWTPPPLANPASAGKWVWFDAVRQELTEPPADWESALLEEIRLGPSWVAAAALDVLSASMPVTNELQMAIVDRLADACPRVRLEAAQAATRLAAPALLPAYSQWLRAETNPDVLQFCPTKLGGFEIWCAWAERINPDNRALATKAVDALSHLIADRPNSGAGGRTDLSDEELAAIQNAWLELLHTHEAAIRAGHRFTRDDPAIQADLFGQAIEWEFPDGTGWPTKSQ